MVFLEFVAVAGSADYAGGFRSSLDSLPSSAGLVLPARDGHMAWLEVAESINKTLTVFWGRHK
jgi:hypothetical protein